MIEREREKERERERGRERQRQRLASRIAASLTGDCQVRGRGDDRGAGTVVSLPLTPASGCAHTLIHVCRWCRSCRGEQKDVSLN